MSDIRKILEHVDQAQAPDIEVDEIIETVIYEDEDPASELADIKDQIKELVMYAMDIVKQTVGYDSSEYERAKRYWYGHIITALDDDNDFMGGSMHSLQDTIDELRNKSNDENGFGGYDDATIEQEYRHYTKMGMGHEEAVQAIADSENLEYNGLLAYINSRME